jgi:hypothetical protein
MNRPSQVDVAVIIPESRNPFKAKSASVYLMTFGRRLSHVSRPTPDKRRFSVTTFRVPNSKVKELLVLTSPRSRVILGPFDILVDIGVPAEKEVIQ